jgi:NAD(P)-dependent dehydrogenase (short-subunit alcohol dehydrogenase family)
MKSCLTYVRRSDSEPSVLEKDLLDSFNVNVIGVVKTINTFMPLIQKSAIKKVITISTGMADPDLVNSFEIDNAAPYAISKSATNMTIAKYNALYKKDGVLFLAISPGLVDTGHNLREFKCRLSSEGRIRTSQLLLLTQRFGNSAARSSDDPQIRGIRAAL